MSAGADCLAVFVDLCAARLHGRRGGTSCRRQLLEGNDNYRRRNYSDRTARASLRRTGNNSCRWAANIVDVDHREVTTPGVRYIFLDGDRRLPEAQEF